MLRVAFFRLLWWPLSVRQYLEVQLQCPLRPRPLSVQCLWVCLSTRLILEDPMPFRANSEHSPYRVAGGRTYSG